MIIVDTETTGMEVTKHALLSIGAIDLQNPDYIFYEECRIWEGAHVDDEALKINGFSKESITDSKKQSEKDTIEHFLKWIEGCSEHTLAGQNTSFDRDFLKSAVYRYHINWPFTYRVIDLYSVAYAHMISHGVTPPVKGKHSDLNLDKILVYCGIMFTRGVHNALEDAKLEAEALSRLFFGKGLLPEFAKFSIPWISK